MACFIAYVECWHAAALRIGAWHAGMFLIGVYYCIRNHVRNWLARRKNRKASAVLSDRPRQGW